MFASNGHGGKEKNYHKHVVPECTNYGNGPFYYSTL